MKLVIYSVYPPDEIYLSNEIMHLRRYFDILFISRNYGVVNNKRVESHKNIVVKEIEKASYDLVIWYKTLFFSLINSDFINEISYATIKRKVGIKSLKRILEYTAMSTIDSQKIYNILKEINWLDEPLLFYSYRLDSSCLTLLRLKKQMYYSNEIKCISRCHGIDLYENRNEDNYLPYRRKFFRELFRIHCISEHAKKYLSNSPYTLCPLHVSRLGTIDSGVSEFINNNPQLTIVTCSRVDENKRLKLVVEALSLIKHLSINWTHIGDGKLFLQIKEMANNLLTSNIQYKFLGNINNNAILNYYKKNYIDLFINVSYDEGLPVSIMEAISFGIPVIATSVGGTNEIVRNEENGYLLSRDFSAEELASLLVKFYNISNEEKELMRTKSRLTWKTLYNQEKNYEDFSLALFAEANLDNDELQRLTL